MGAIAYEAGVAVRVWASHSDRVFVTGSFNNWMESHPMQPGDDGTWYAEVPEAEIGDEFCGTLRLYRDLVQLCLNRAGYTRGLCGRGIKVHHVNEETKLLAFHRWDRGGPGDHC